MKKELTYYYKIKKPDHVTEDVMEREVKSINKILYNYAFTKITYPTIKSNYGGVFYSRHYDSYVIKVQFINKRCLQYFKIRHMNIYMNLKKEHPQLVFKEDFL